MKTEYLVFSDFHAHNFTYGAKRVQAYGNTYNSRLVSQVDALQEMLTYGRKNGISEVLFGGDLFHTRDAVPTDVMHLVHYVIHETEGEYRQINWYLNIGNHDQFSQDGEIHSLSVFKSEPCVVVASPEGNITGTRAGGAVLHMSPYVYDGCKGSLGFHSNWIAEKQEAAVNRAQRIRQHILVAHTGIQGAKVGSNYILVDKNDLDIRDVDFSRFDICLFGHFHEHQQVFDNGWYIGALTQHNWGDVGGKRGFLHLTMDDELGLVDFKHIETSAPKFIVLTDGDDASHVRPNDFVRIYTADSTEASANKIRATMTNDNVEILPIPEELRAKTLDVQGKDIFNIEAVFLAWVKAHNKDLDEAELINAGKQILASVQE